MVKYLPIFREYTVDERLREFRKVERGINQRIEFVPFDSDQGRRLLKEMRRRRGVELQGLSSGG